MADFDLKLFRLHRISNGETENYSVVTQQQWEMETPFLLEDEGQSELLSIVHCALCIVTYLSKWFEPRSISSLSIVIVRVSVVLVTVTDVSTT